MLLCLPTGPGSIPGMSRSESAITRGNPIMLLGPTTFLCTTRLFANLLAGFLARDCHEGIRTCDHWVSVLIRGYRRAIGTLEFPVQLVHTICLAQMFGKTYSLYTSHCTLVLSNLVMFLLSSLFCNVHIAAVSFHMNSHNVVR